jgi:hypothetical protein
MLLNKAWTTISRMAGRRAMTSAAVDEAPAGAGALVAAVGTTFGTYMIADFLSNFIQHPTQAMDYGFFNSIIGREVDRKFWGTRKYRYRGIRCSFSENSLRN